MRQRRGTTPEQLRRRPRWIRYNGHKVPLTITNAPASSTNPTTWSTHAAARDSSAGQGCGFVLNGDGIVCIDIDHCIDDQGNLAAWAEPLLQNLPPTYIEISPSGHGLHIWGTGTNPGRCVVPLGTGTIEIYQTGRYLTITDNPFRGSVPHLATLTKVIAGVQ